jgi:chemotaxis protein methyltransferase CheR
VIGISTTILPDRQHRGVYRGQNCIHAQPAGMSLPREPLRALAGTKS